MKPWRFNGRIDSGNIAKYAGIARDAKMKID
jgi:hypothetical protein